ncbi:MAG TPA: cysteine rich repeat-containing protein [Casimicrobiaceae bacterium]|nr:cysteine rich repeat-containing protein [Casimicrobiaceae bacterium]
MKYAVLATAALGLSATAALAADQPSSSGPRTACKADVEKFCHGVQPGGGRIAACLKQNEAQVSTGCKNAVAKARQNKAPPGSNAPQGSPQG